MELREMVQRIVAFRDAREWKQFHNPKDMALSLMLESAEVAEHFQWKSPDEIAAYVRTDRGRIGEELCDVLSWVLLMAHDLEIDLPAAFALKMAQNEAKYPVEKSRGNHAKYSAL